MGKNISEILMITDFSQRSFAHLLFKAAALVSLRTVRGRRGRAGCASQHRCHRPLRQKALSRIEAAGLAEAKPANLGSPAPEGIPPALSFFACITMQSCTLISVPVVPVFIAVIFLYGQHNPQI